MVCAAETPLKNTQILGCESLASWIAAVTQTRMDFSCVFVRNWRRITSGPTLRPWRLLGTDPCLLRSSLKSRDTLKYRSWVSALCDFTMCLCLTLCLYFCCLCELSLLRSAEAPELCSSAEGGGQTDEQWERRRFIGLQRILQPLCLIIVNATLLPLNIIELKFNTDTYRKCLHF